MMLAPCRRGKSGLFASETVHRAGGFTGLGNNMNAPIVRRAANGTLLPGSQLNVAGRPVGSISEFRRRFEPHMGEVAETLLALMRSPNENTRLQAVREILDRTLGRAAIAIDTTHTRVDIGELYLSAL